MIFAVRRATFGSRACRCNRRKLCSALLQIVQVVLRAHRRLGVFRIDQEREMISEIVIAQMLILRSVSALTAEACDTGMAVHADADNRQSARSRRRRASKWTRTFSKGERVGETNRLGYRR